jgi:hypothetical protein
VKKKEEKKKAQEKGWFDFSSLFLCTVGSGIRYFLTPRIRIRVEKFRDPDPGSGIKHPGSATLGKGKPLKNVSQYFRLCAVAEFTNNPVGLTSSR